MKCSTKKYLQNYKLSTHQYIFYLLYVYHYYYWKWHIILFHFYGLCFWVLLNNKSIIIFELSSTSHWNFVMQFDALNAIWRNFKYVYNVISFVFSFSSFFLISVITFKWTKKKVSVIHYAFRFVFNYYCYCGFFSLIIIFF